jgi:hypothetical protein
MIMSRPYPPYDYEEERRRVAATRDYTTPAVLTLVLYFVMWLPGLIANIIYYLQAAEDERISGYPPRGKGCLLALLIVWIAVPLVATVMICAMFAIFGSLSAVTTR